MFSLQILSVDSYQGTPIKGYDYLYSEFRSCETYRVPIIRIIGKTTAGQTSCLHVHGVYPYLLLRWKDVFPGVDIKDSHKYLQELALEIDKALHVASRKSGSSHHHVFKISVEKKFCFYGYHQNEENFLKVYFYEPRDVSRSSELLANGAIRNKSIQPHQAHFPFTFQFLVDFNLSGMDVINVSQFQFRASKDTQMSDPSPQGTQSSPSLFDDSSSSVKRKWNVTTLHSSQILAIPRKSICELELDCCFNDILNKSEIAGCAGENPGIAAIWAEERMRRRTENDTSLITPVPSQDRVNAFETESEIQYKSLLRDFLKRHKLKCDNQLSEEADAFFPSGSQNSFFQSSGSINLSTTQDMQVLGDLLSMANNNDPENDSILGFVVDSDSEEETIAMSQRFTAEPWTPQIMGSQILQENNPSSVLEKFSETASPVLIPQLDGTYDDDDIYEEFGPMLFKEEKEPCTVNAASNAVTEFDDEPPVLQPEQPLKIQNVSELQNSQILECSVKMENHPIFKNLDLTKPILLRSLENNVSSLCLEKSTSSSITYNSNIKASKSHQKVSKKSRKFDHTIQKCLSSVISKVEERLDGESRADSIQTTKTVFKYSEVHVTKVTTTSTTECPKPELQCTSKSRLAKSFTVDACSKDRKSVSSKTHEMNSLKHKSYSWRTHDKPKKDVFKSSCDKTKSNNDFINSSAKTSRVKNDSLPLSSHQKSLVTAKKKSKFTAAKLTTKSDIVVEKVSLSKKSNNCTVKVQDVFSNLTTNLTKKNKLSKHKSESSHDSVSVTKGGVDICKVNNPELKTVESGYKMENKTFPLSNNSLISNDSEVENYQSLNLDKLGSEMVVVKKLTQLEIDNLTKLSSQSVSEQTYRASKDCPPNSEHLQKIDQSNHRKKHVNSVSDLTANYPTNGKLASERKIAKVSKKFKNSKSSFNNDFIKTCLESQPLNNKPNSINKHSSLSLFNNDDSDFKNSFNSFAPNKNVLETSPNKHNKNKKMSRLSSNHEKKSSKNSSHLRKKSFPRLEVSAKPFEEVKKKVIEEQVKFSLEEKNEFPEVSIISVQPDPTSALKVVPEIVDITSDDEDMSMRQQTLKDEAMIPEEYKDCILRSLKVNLIECSDLIKKYCPDEFAKLTRKQQKREILSDSKSKAPKVQLKSELKSHSSLQCANQEPCRPKIKCERKEISRAPSHKSTQHAEPKKADDSKLLYAVKSEPLAIKETYNNKARWNFNSTIDANLLSSNVLPYAVKSKPVVKCGSNSNVISNVALGSDTGIYAVKSKPPVKTVTKSLLCDATPPKLNDLILPKSCSNSKLQMNKSIPKVVLPSFKKTSFWPKDENKLNLNETKNSIVVNEKNGNTSTSKIPKKKKDGFDFKSPILKNSGAIPKKNGFHPKENVAMKSCRESEVVKELASNDFLSKESIHILPEKITSSTANLEVLDSKLESSHLNHDSLINEHALKTPSESPSTLMKKKSPKLLDKKSKSLDLSTSTNISPSDCKAANQKNQKTALAPLKKSSSSKTPLATNSSNTVTKIQSQLIINNNKEGKNLTGISASMIEESSHLPIIENDLYDIVKRRTANKNNCVSKTNSVANSDKMLNNNCNDKLLPNSKPSRGARKSVTISKDDLLPYPEKADEHSTYNEKIAEKIADKSNCISKTSMLANTDKVLNNCCVDKLLSNSKLSKNDRRSLYSSKEGLLPFPEKNDDHSTSTGSVTSGKTTEKVANKNNCISKNNKKVNIDEVLNNSCVDKHLLNSKSSKGARENATSSKDAKLPFLRKIDDQYVSSESVTSEKANEKLKCNFVIECKPPSIDKPSVYSNDKTLMHSSEEEGLIQTREESSHASNESSHTSNESSHASNESSHASNESSHDINESSHASNESPQASNESPREDFVPINEDLNNHAATISAEAAISNNILGSQAANIEAPISPLSFVCREKKKGNEFNNFSFFCNSNKKRRPSPETSLGSKPLSSKLSLKLNKTKITTTAKVKTTSPMHTVTRRNRKIDNGLLIENPQPSTSNSSKDPESVNIKKEPLDEDNVSGQNNDMKEALSRFDFDENASSEPASCLAYTSNRYLKNNPKASAAKTALKDRKHKKSPRKQKKHPSTRHRKSAKKSTRSNILPDKNSISDTSATESPKVPVIQKFKILRSSAGHVVVPNSRSESLPGNSSQSPDKSQEEEQENNINKESEDKPKQKGTHPQMKIRIKKIDSISEESEQPQFECILISDSDSSKEDAAKVKRKKKKRRESTSQISPSEPLSLPVPIQDIKKEKIDDYEQAPLKLNLCRKKENEFYVCNRISSSENVSVNPSVSPLKNETKVPKRGRGRPRKNCKDVSPIKSENSLCDDRITSFPVPKKSAALPSLEIDELNSFKPLGRKTRSNSARASTSYNYCDVKIKQEPISDEEYAPPSTATPELQTSIKTRRKSLQCENFTKFFESKSDSDSDEPNVIKPKSPKKKTSRKEKTRGNSNASLPKEIPNYRVSCGSESESHVGNLKSPSKKKALSHETEDNSCANATRVATKRRASATNSYTKYYDSDSDDDCQIVRVVSPPKPKRPTRQRQQSSPAKKLKIENSVVAPDSPKDNNYNCQVMMKRLLPSEIEKHCSDPHTLNTDESGSKSVSAISDVVISSSSKRSKTSFDMEKHPNETHHQRITRAKERDSVLVATPIGNAPIKLIPDTHSVNLRKLASSMDTNTETLQEKTLQENNCVQFTIPPVNIDINALPGDLLREPSSQIESLTPVSTPENVMAEDIKPEAEQCSTTSPGIHKGSTTTFEEGWDSPPGEVPMYPSDGDSSLTDTLNKSLEPSHLADSNRCPEMLQMHSTDESKQVNIDSACSSVKETSNTQSKVSECSIIPKNCDGKNIFDKIPEEMHECVGMSKMFCHSNQNICYPEEDLLSLEPRSLIAPQKVIPSDKTTCEVRQIIKPLKKDYERTQGNQTVSCFKGYDLQSETGMISPSFAQKGSTTTDVLDIPTQGNSDFSFLSDNYSSHLEVRKPHSIGNPQSNNKHVNSFNNNFFNSYNTSRTHEDFTSMQLDTNPFSSSSYLEVNRSQPNFSIGQSKYSNSFSDAKSNMHTNNPFNSTGWDNFNKSFCPIESFQEKDMPSNISQQKKLDDQFARGKTSNGGFFNGAQFGDANAVHLPNYFTPDESERIWSPTEQVKSDNAFDRHTEMSSPGAHPFPIEMPSSITNSFMAHSPFMDKSPLNESLQGSQLSEHVSGMGENDFVGSFGTNSPSMLPSQLTVESKSGGILSPYYAGNNPPTKLKDDEAIDSVSASLSDVLAGSPLDMENDSLNCDAFTPSIEKTVPKSEPVSQVTETQNYFKNETQSPIGDNDKPANKCDKPELSHLTATSFRSLDFSDFTDDTEMDPNLFGVYTNSPTQAQSYCEPSYEKLSKSKVEHSATGEIKDDNLSLTETFPSTKTNSTIDTSVSYKVPFENNVIPLVTLNTPPSEEHFTQLPIPNFSSANQSFLSTLLVGESVMVPQSNIFINSTSVITSSDSPSHGYVNILPNSESVTISSDSIVSDAKDNDDSNGLKQSFDGSEDILSMIVKSCAIGEEFDENLDSPVENINESVTNEVNNSACLDSKIDSFYGNNTLYDLNQTNTETFCSNIQNLNGTCEALPSPISESKESCINNVNKNSSHHSGFPSSHLSVSSVDKFKKTSIPSSKKQRLAYCDKTISSNNYAPYPKTKRKINGEVFNNGYEEPSCEDSQSSDGVKSNTREKKETSYCHNSKPNCNSQLHSGLQSFSNSLMNTNFLSGDNLESTPTASRHESRTFLSEKLSVSPINKDNLLTSDNKRKRPCEPTPVRSKKLFKGLEKDTAEGPFAPWFWETTSITDRFKDFDVNLSKSDLDGPTLENSRGFKLNVDDMGDARVRHEVQHLTIMSLEIHVNTRSDLNPDPRFDSVAAIFYSIYKDVGSLHQEIVGIIAVDNSCLKTNSFHGTHASLKNFLSLSSCVEKSEVCCVTDENELFQKLVSIVREKDPDIMVGYEIQMASWGYLIERAGILNMNLASKLSRLVNLNESKFQQVEEDPTVTDQTADLDRINIPGRIVLNLWRLLRKEVNLNIYSFENVYFHLLHKRTPSYTFQDLTNWFNSGVGREEVVRYYATRVVGCLQFLDKVDLIRRTSELARLFGIQFYEVLSRGSQFRVESMMLRSAAPMQYVPVTPSIQQRSRMKAPESVPLILEPESKYYKDPVLVLDFQSLYPSMIIAYNYCFSTCLGRVEHLGKEGSFDFGCTSLDISPEELHKLAEEDNIHFSPNGVAFVKREVRKGVLPTMLKEILDTRVMVKMAMKKIRGNPALKKLLDARQLGLKLISNVTYGYTAASFSGRMPCVEVADSIVAKGRETLERAIRMIEENPYWNARAVYGDTDSIFVLLSGRTVEEAFKIGQEIVEAVNAVNPKPVKLKLEKVYHRCVLQSKKRYVGFMYETVDQAKPIFDAKGIETVRRDSCPATAKILEKSLKTLFRTDNANLVQQYVQKQFRKLLAGRVNMTDFIFAKEYRGMAGYRPTACVPALEITKKRLMKDPRSEPRSGERVPYVVVYGFPGMPIIKLVHEPIDLLKDPNLRINITYYITRVISPPLDRVFSLMGCDVKTWYNNLNHTTKLNLPTLYHPGHQRETITQYFVTRNCPSCEENTTSPVCEACRRDPQGTVVTLQDKIRKWERAESDLKKICISCTKSSSSVDSCASFDCPILFKLNLAKRDCSQIPYLRKVLAQELF